MNFQLFSNCGEKEIKKWKKKITRVGTVCIFCLMLGNYSTLLFVAHFLEFDCACLCQTIPVYEQGQQFQPTSIEVLSWWCLIANDGCNYNIDGREFGMLLYHGTLAFSITIFIY